MMFHCVDFTRTTNSHTTISSFSGSLPQAHQQKSLYPRSSENRLDIKNSLADAERTEFQRFTYGISYNDRGGVKEEAVDCCGGRVYGRGNANEGLVSEPLTSHVRLHPKRHVETSSVELPVRRVSGSAVQAFKMDIGAPLGTAGVCIWRYGTFVITIF